jgi:hypothetical protein
MRALKNELDVDYIGNQAPIPDEDKEAIRNYFKKKKLKSTSRRNRRIVSTRRKSLLSREL